MTEIATSSDDLGDGTHEIEKIMNTVASPVVLLGLDPSFGFGDRIGLATPGHVEAMRRAGQGIRPIFPQQSIREMNRTGRSAREVMDDAVLAMKQSDWTEGTGADADHLKTREDVDRTAAVGFTFFTIDPSDHVDEKSDSYDEATLRRRFDEVRDDIDWIDAYRGKQTVLSTGTRIDFGEETIMRAAVKYGRALRAGLDLAAYIQAVHDTNGKACEIELSIDETEQPTTLAEHLIIAEQCLRHGMKLVSLAPRFIGEMEKGIDYIGDVNALEKSLSDHVAIADMLGPYKLSLHSGSDKISMYAVLARATKGRFHVKTAGTSYLEALRVAARHEPELFRRVIAFARQHYDADKATYHVHATVGGVPGPDELPRPLDLERAYLERWEEVPQGKGLSAPGRQILHCTFGSTLTDPDLGPALRDCLGRYAAAYRDLLALHFERHLQALQAGLNRA